MEGQVDTKPRVCFEVEKVIGISEDGSYKVQWAPAWVSKFHLVGCEHLIQEFLEGQLHEDDRKTAAHETPDSPNDLCDTEMLIQQQQRQQQLLKQQQQVLLQQQYQLKQLSSSLGSSPEVESKPELSPIEEESTPEGGDPSSVKSEEKKDAAESKSTYDITIKLENDEEMTVIGDASSDVAFVVGTKASSSLPLMNDMMNSNTPLPWSTSGASAQPQIPNPDELAPNSANHYPPLDIHNFDPEFTPRGTTNETSEKYSKKKHVCTICNKRFSCQRNLRVHHRTHSGDRPYECTHCGKRFSQSGDLGRHLRTHSGEKPYSCDVCSKSFSDSSNLKSHMRTHSNEKPYTCMFCEKSFSYKPSLERHVQTHTGIQPYTCDTCDTSFADSTLFKKHMITHGVTIVCDICNKSFADMVSLKTHLMKTHNTTGDNNY